MFIHIIFSLKMVLKESQTFCIISSFSSFKDAFNEIHSHSLSRSSYKLLCILVKTAAPIAMMMMHLPYDTYAYIYNADETFHDE